MRPVTAFFILSPFAVALVALWLAGRTPWAPRILAAWPALLTIVFSTELAATEPK